MSPHMKKLPRSPATFEVKQLPDRFEPVEIAHKKGFCFDHETVSV